VIGVTIQDEARGRLAENIAYFGRALRKAGLPVGPAHILDAISAVEAAGIGEREDFYWTLHAIFVSKREHQPVFHEAFELFWRERGLIDKLLQILSPVAPAGPREKAKPRAAESRVADAFRAKQENRVEERPLIEVDARLSLSDREVLQAKDFAQMSAAEIAAATKAIAEMAMPRDALATRRQRAALRGAIDRRRTLRASLRVGGDIVLPQFKAPRMERPPIVAVCDISGSMADYSRIMLHFLHALAAHRKVQSFVFGTRLTNITRQLRTKDPDEALASCSAAVADWSGGTRIAEALHVFNRDWSRRVLGGRATVLLITDGLERGGEADLGREMDRLHRSCRRLVWLNPLLRFEGFEARARGVRAMLPHVDDFRPVHSLQSVADLVAALDHDLEGGDPKLYLKAA